jgi:hypothetical protein
MGAKSEYPEASERQASSNARFVIPPPPIPGCSPWPWPILIPAPRGDPGSMPLGQSDGLELVQTVYLRPDVRAAVVANTVAFTELLSRDEEAAQAFAELIGGVPTRTEGETGDRLAPLLIALALAGGLCAGYYSRP